MKALNKPPLLTAALISLALLAGCDGTESSLSENVDTSTIWAGMRLEADGDGVTDINVELNEDNRTGTNIRLSSGERLEVEGGGFAVVLAEDFDLLDVDYEGSVVTDASGTRFDISLFRADGSIINGSTVDLPDQFSVTAPADGESFVYGSTIDLAWSPDTGRTISLETITVCRTNTGTATVVDILTIADIGSYALDTTDIDGPSRSDVDRTEPCSLSLNLRRENDGVLDTRFRGGGFIRAVQQRPVDNLRITF